ncbi:helix-turn-helix domain-containing protein [Pseudonocardia broussonetiae]|uniref:Helix-turn-helix transcriptional regulator n=1 Tax=Pseudonocardia broussonetiae TaxID=2736640 RepID=A0A6M6JIF6_9PSEU|nr:helix-turn-helix transcriptional regulator [Pseudonocardia broussonetiae]
MTAAQSDAAPPPSFTETVAEELRVHLVRRQVTGRELARRLHVSSQWVSQRTRGAVALSTADLERIADALGMSPMELLAGIPFRSSAPQTTTRTAAPTGW